MFSCDQCNYTTYIKSNFNRHLNTAAHIKLTNNDKKKYICSCGKQFMYASGLSKHKKTCIGITGATVVKELQGQVEELMSEVELLKLEKKDDRIIQLLQELVNKGSNSNTTYNLSVKNYVQKNFPEAPSLGSPNDYGKLTHENQELIDTLLYYHRHKSLYKHLGDFIVGYYKKDDPALQSVWTSDVARLTYVIKELLAEKQSIWNHDPKGVKTKKYIITPMLEYIRNYINDYWNKNLNCDKKGKVDVDALVKRQEIYNSIYEIRMNIDTGVLGDEILRYIAADLHIDNHNIKTSLKKLIS